MEAGTVSSPYEKIKYHYQTPFLQQWVNRGARDYQFRVPETNPTGPREKISAAVNGLAMQSVGS